MKNDAIIKAKRFSILKFNFLFLFSIIMVQACAQTIDNSLIMRNKGIVPTMKITNFLKTEVDPMKIDELKINIKVFGQIAVTTLEFSYFNTNNRVLEGEFNFPLAEGQTISRFALDINGQMREGVVVEKEQGRKTFEAIVRRGVDPGLLEMTEGNNFRARVYPLPAKGYRKIIITYEQELSDKGKGYLYQLPLNINEEIRSFSIHVEVIKQQVIIDTEENELSNFEFKKWNDAYISDFTKENYLANKQLAFIIPNNSLNSTYYTESFANGNDSSYFYINCTPKKFEKEKILPKKIILFWDNSNSCSVRDIEKELKLLDNYFQKIQNIQVELVPFNISTEKSKIFSIASGNWNNLQQTLSDMNYDGGTSFDIDFSKYSGDEILVFSDGLSNFGLSNPTFSSTPVIVINSNAIANHSFLNYLTQKNGGQYINLSKLSSKEALESLTKTNYHFISATIVDGKISESYPNIPSQFNGSFSIAGILKGKSANISLNFGFGNTVVYSEKITISTKENGSSGILKRIWAQKKLTSLNIDEDANKDAIMQLGKEYGIVTANTSLIVLDNLSDYLLNHIVPPKEMQADYYSRLNEDKKTEADKIKNHIDYVAGLFDTRLKWWNTPILKVTEKNHKFKSTVVDDSMVDMVSSEDMVMEERNDAVTEDLAETIQVSNAVKYTQIASSYAASVSVSENETSTEKLDVNENTTNVSIQLNAWDPQTPYAKVLQYASKGQEYETYLKLKKEYGNTPMFYADASDFFAKAGQNEIALKILSNLAELKLEEPNLLRIMGKKLQLLNQKTEAVNVFKKVLKLRGEEPQSYRDLGLAYEANAQYQQAITTLYEVVKREWNGRFPAIELIALEELNSIIANQSPKLDYSFIDKRLIKSMPLDIRVVLTWDTDNCDMDLWVTDPSGEKCFFQHNETQIGGLISLDFTGGYGPEEFLLKKAINGEYIVQTNYYGTHSQTLLAPVTLHLTFYTNYGKKNQKMQETTIRLDNQKDIIDIGKFTFSSTK